MTYVFICNIDDFVKSRNFIEFVIPENPGSGPGQASESSYFVRIISKLVEKKTGFFSEKDLFSVGSANREDSLWPNGFMPGQKSIRLAKKGGDPFFPDAGFRRFSQGIPFPPRLFAETKRGELGRVLPALFVFGACFLARATRRRV